ncbi:MAG: hypothetical protein HQK83_18265 [Fibrobacteria bacterium]|nr:hypothetical protein [Fibrobacteria bacterium]
MYKTILVNGSDTLLHGPSIILSAEGDTLVHGIYEKNKIIRQKVCEVKQEFCKIHDYEIHITIELKQKEGIPYSEKKLKGDSVISWTYWDNNGKSYTYKAWHIMHSKHYYDEYIKYMNTFKPIPINFNYRFLFVLANSRPGMIDVTPHHTVKLYLFDYQDDRYEYKHVIEKSKKKWVKYNTQLLIKEFPLSKKLQEILKAFKQDWSSFPNIKINWDTKELDSYFILTENEKTASYLHVPADSTISHLNAIFNASGYNQEIKLIDEKLKEWKQDDRKDYFLEEIFKLPYLLNK